VIADAQLSVHRAPSQSTVRSFPIVLQAIDFVCMPIRVVVPLSGIDDIRQPRTRHEHMAPILVSGGDVDGLNPFDRATLGVRRFGALVVSIADDNDARWRIHDS
jgi:hypothetical protein